MKTLKERVESIQNQFIRTSDGEVGILLSDEGIDCILDVIMFVEDTTPEDVTPEVLKICLLHTLKTMADLSPEIIETYLIEDDSEGGQLIA